MTVSRRELTAAAGVSKGAAVNSRWDQLNPLYCANQALVYANVQSTLQLGDTTPATIRISSNASSTTQNFIGVYGSGNTFYLPMFSVNFSSNTITTLNTSFTYSSSSYGNVKFNEYAKVLDNGVILLTERFGDSGTGGVDYVSIQALLANASSKTLTLGNPYFINVGNSASGFSANPRLARVNSTAAVWEYETIGANSFYNQTVLSLVIVNPANGNLTIASSTVVGSNIGTAVAYNSIPYGIAMANTSRGFISASPGAASNSSIYPFTINANNTITVGTPTSVTANLSFFPIGTVQVTSNGNTYHFFNSRNYAGTSSDSTGFTYSTSSNSISNLNYAGNNTTLMVPLSSIPTTILNNNVPSILGLQYDLLNSENYNSLFLRTIAVNSTPSACPSSKFGLIEVTGQSNGITTSYPKNSFGEVHPLIGTTRAVFLQLGAPGYDTVNFVSTNTAVINYRFVDANPSSQTFIYNVPGANSFTAPRAGQLFIQCYGAGGRGNTVLNGNAASGSNTFAGGGGAFAYKTITVTSGQVISLNIASGSLGGTTIANTIICGSGTAATRSATGTGGAASGGDFNANGSAGTQGTISNIAIKGDPVYVDTSQPGKSGAPGPAKTGFGYTTSTQIYGNSFDPVNSPAIMGIGIGGTLNVSSTGVVSGGRAGGNGAIIIGIK